MASKRLREENDEDLANKNPKPSVPVDIISLLDEEVNDDSTEHLFSLIKTLEQKISTAAAAPESDANGPSLSSSFSTDEEEEERERVMRHLLEASDDELGLPAIEASGSGGVTICSGGFVSGGSGEEEGFDVCDGVLWQLEDEAANYYDLMQSEQISPT